MTGILACHSCKRRKIKCDRQLPECAFCRERSQKCEYPTEARKPGPKPGSRKRSSLASVTYGKDAAANANDTLPVDNSTDFPLASGLHPPNLQPCSPVNSFTSVTPESNLLSRMIHPGHDTRPPSETDAAGSLIELGAAPCQTERAKIVRSICSAFDISQQSYENLITAYFDNMTAFSLFHRPRFEKKLCGITSSRQLQALLAAMFSFSSQFVKDIDHQLSPAQLHQLAQRLVVECLAESDEDTPPLCVLQAMILTTFQQLTSGVRGRSWRSLGDCIRVALELRLHQVDQEDAGDAKPLSPPAEWIVKEEKRRAWWAIWELDVFASTIKCLPTGISWRNNHTHLPVDDSSWYTGVPIPSCPLPDDPSMRWKLLEQSGNRGSNAWFIVANSFMRNAQTLTAQVDPGSLKDTQYPESPGILRTLASERMIIENSVSCLTIALPAELSFKQNYLAFRESRPADGLAMCYMDSARYSIHMMIQLTRLMIHRHEVFWHAHRILRSAESDPQKPDNDRRSSTSDSTVTMSELRAWNHYLDAANSIVQLVRSSSQNHVQHVNPMLANTIWLAAAAQVLCSVFGPEQTDRRVAESNLDLLRSTFKLYGKFWDIDASLQERLDSLETSLQSLKSRKTARHHQQTQTSRNKNATFPNGMERLLETTASQGGSGAGLSDSLQPELDPMILGNEPSLQMSPFDPFLDPGEGYNPFTIDLDELFAYGYA